MTTQPRRETSDAVRTVGDYTLLSRIGEGGMGVVHLARKPGGERVAVKILRPHIVGDDEARARLAREVNSLGRIRSRWVAEIVDADPWAPVPYVATRYVPGLSLHDHVREEGPIVGADLLWFAGCLAEGLAAVHAVGVLHRDVKPSNVLMEGRTPILIDFGLARVADDPKLTHTGWLLGTPGYLAPEILYGDDASPASDLHSWGATVAFAATGAPPFGRGPSMAIMDRVRRGEFDLSGIESPLCDVIAATLEPDPARRPTLEALLTWLRPQTTRPAPLLGAPPAAVGLHAATDDDMFTAPLALAAQANAAAPTLVEPTAVERHDTSMLPQHPRPLPTRVDPTWPLPPPAAYEQVHPQPYLSPPPYSERVAGAERVRRFGLMLAVALLTGAVCAIVPWLAVIAVLVVVWLLRSGSLAASAIGDRRRLRGRRWYDGVQLLVHAPWHLVQSIPGTLMLVLWSAGLAAAAALVCYAAGTAVPLTLFVSGVVLAGSLWWGPGGSRLRSPVSRVLHPLARSTGSWVLAVVVLLVAAAGIGLVVEARGVSWAPGSERPFADAGR